MRGAYHRFRHQGYGRLHSAWLALNSFLLLREGK
jgi:hypothetical protein